MSLPLINLSNAEATFIQCQECKHFWKPSKPCHSGIYWIALIAYSQISTHTPGFSGFFKDFVHYFVLANLATFSIRVKHWHWSTLTHKCSQRSKVAWQFWWIFQPKADLEKIFVQEMCFKPLSTTHLQIVCKIILNLQVIVKSIKDPDDNFKCTS